MDSTEALQTIQRSSRAMVRLIEELLDMSVIESGKHSLKLSSMMLESFIDYCVRQSSGTARSKAIEIESPCCEGVTLYGGKRS